MSRRHSAFALLLLTGACATAPARQQVSTLPSLWGDLKPGGYQAGFREAEHVCIWYPASSDGKRIRYRDYVGALDDLEKVLHERHVSDQTIVDLFDTAMYARRDARPASESPRLVVIALSDAQTAGDISILAEFLASHGYVVAALPTSIATALLGTHFTQVQIDGARWLHNVNFSSLALASARFPELARTSKADGREATSIANKLLQFLGDQRTR
ncbi:MAG: hypothetical protein ACXW3E_15100 [Thermoanaerobaculia bacterium]